MRVVVTGGRTYNDKETLYKTLDSFPITSLASGDAKGADTLTAGYAQDRGLYYDCYHADWDTYGIAAGPIRNELLLADFKPDLVIAFPGGRGTRHCVGYAEYLGIKVFKIDEKKKVQPKE